jgi:DNA replication protein DnaC
MTPAQLEAEIAALGRPGMSLAGFRAIAQSLERAKAWDAANPEKAARYHALCAKLDAETKRLEREAAERLALERALRTSSAKLARCGAGDRSLAAAADPDDTEALAIVKRWLAEKGKVWLALCGVPGTGKSVAATWAVREVIRSGSTAAFRKTSEIAKLSGFEAGAAEMEHLKSVDLLALDDFGTELLTDYARAQLFELLDARHEAYGRTILTSNLLWMGPGGMAERLGERLVDRIADGGTRQQLSKATSLRRRS